MTAGGGLLGCDDGLQLQRWRVLVCVRWEVEWDVRWEVEWDVRWEVRWDVRWLDVFDNSFWRALTFVTPATPLQATSYIRACTENMMGTTTLPVKNYKRYQICQL